MGIEEIFAQIVIPTKGLEASNDPALIQEWLDLNDRHIWINGEIAWEVDSFVIRMIQFLNRTDLSENPKPIHLHIFSPGGELSTMFALYTAIQMSRIPIFTYNEGIAHSAAFIVFLAGEKRFASPYAVSVAHEGSSQMGGSYRESKAAMQAYEKDVQEMKNIIAQRTRLSLEDIEQHFETSQDWYIRYDEMIDLGIINAYLGDDSVEVKK